MAFWPPAASPAIIVVTAMVIGAAIYTFDDLVLPRLGRVRLMREGETVTFPLEEP